MINKKKLIKISSLALFLALTAALNNFSTSVHAESINSNEKASVIQWAEKKDVSTIKTWTINFRTPVDISSIFENGNITVTDSKGNLIDVKVSTGNDDQCIYVEPSKEGYKENETYYLNISKNIKFRDNNKSIKAPVQMKFTTTDIGTINVDENSPITGANNNFGFNLIKNLINKDKNKNMIISPLSVSTILSMTQNGADKETKEEMKNCIGLKNISDKDINSQYYGLLDYYNNLKLVNLKVANSIWVNKQINLNNDFKNITNKYYGSQVSSEDFENKDTVNKINQWVNQATKGQINKIIDDISNDDTAVLINSLYFKGRWQDEFSTNNTKKEEFTLANGEKINVDNMEGRGYVNYLKEDNFQAISLPYYDGIEMDLFLPNEGVKVDNFIQSLTKENFDKWVSEFEGTDVVQQIPKFKMEYDTDLKDTLESLGMNEAFDSHKANFKNLATSVGENPMYIGKIKHKACVSVDEQGTEAAAVTAETMTGSIRPSVNPVNFKINRPFFFAIRDNKTGVVLFMGKVENPGINNMTQTN